MSKAQSDVIDLTGISDDEKLDRPTHHSWQQRSTQPYHVSNTIPHYQREPMTTSDVATNIPQLQRPQHETHHAQYQPFQQNKDIQQRFSSSPRPLHQHHNSPNSRTATVSTKPYSTGRPSNAPTWAQTRAQGRTCVNCIAVNVTCDGERPCSACVEPGLKCYYTKDRPSQPFGRSLTHESPANDWPPCLPRLSHDRSPGLQGIASHSKISSTLTGYRTQQSDLLPNNLLSVEDSAYISKAPAARPDESAFCDSEESDDDDVPLAIAELEEVRSLLRKHETRMRDHRAYLLQPLLNQAKLDAANSAQPVRSPTQRNPFASLVNNVNFPHVSNSNKSPLIQIQMKSHKMGGSKKWNQISFPLRAVHANTTILPKYKSIGRLGTSLLAPNIRTLKYWPYFPDEEDLDPSEAKKNEELEERYQHDDNNLLAQRKCSELVDMWRPWVKDFVSKLRIEFSDIFYWFLHTTERTKCATCERDISIESLPDTSRLLSKPTERSLTLARLSTLALREIAKISMWHIALEAESLQSLLKQLNSSKKSISTLCSICFLHNCLSHGAYQEPEESGGLAIMGTNIEINDDEPHHNVKISTVIPNHDFTEDHQCGLYCVTGEVRLKDILGRRKDGTVNGIHNHNIHVPRPTLRNDLTCSENCYWAVEKRVRYGNVAQAKGFEPKLSEKSKDLFCRFLRIYSNNQRAPCMLATEVDGLECIDAFYYMLAEIQRVSHFRQAAQAMQQSTRKISKVAAGLDTTLSAELDERPPFIPCSHSGSCLNNLDCTCAQSKVHCEWFCGCDKSCDRRFPGCKCASTSKTCFMDKSCECWKHNRECDPWLCGTCGVIEVLDPQNKYNGDIRKGRCKNNRIQLELPARTIKAPSEVQGWGLFAGTDLEENTFIGEYKGETVGNMESDRRGAVYANIGQEYLFLMNREQQIDGSNFGNKTRFINNSQRDDYINVIAKKLLCNGVQRVMLHSKKPIKAGEELLYNYNYPVSVTKKFWERGEGPTNSSGVVVAKPSITWTQPRVNGRFAKVAGKQDGEQSSLARHAPTTDFASSEHLGARMDAKRKRVSEADLVFGSAGGAAASTTHRLKNIPGVPGAIQVPDDPDDSDFELVDASESSASAENVDGDSDHPEGSSASRKRQQDRRRGGAAQVKAWETRRKRNGKGK